MNKVLLFIVVAYLTTMMVSCAKGPAGPPGASGQDGDVGLTGDTGATGLQGVPGFDPTPVQLCAACTTHYPDTFAEVVFCYSHKLYGTYSANGGFSTELPEGSYNSAGINCSCTVTIGANCTVTP